ncbi:MAG: GlxA family transcriptional regulator [Ensifer adhaerens]
MSRRSRVPVAGLAGGLYSLARAGVLDGRRCAVHWEHFPDFSERFFAANARQTAFEIDGELFTCAGGNAPFDMFLRIVEDDLGRDVANRICEVALSERVRKAGERQRLPLQTRVGIDNRLLIGIIEQMEANLAEPLKLAEMSTPTGLSRRQIERLFRREMGQSPKRYYLQMRLERAHLLLINSSLPVFEIAVACGFSSASHFSRTYRDTYGCTPQRTRLAEHEHRQPTRVHVSPDMKVA